MPPTPRLVGLLLAVEEQEPPHEPPLGLRHEPDGLHTAASEVSVHEPELEPLGDGTLDRYAKRSVAGQRVGELPEGDVRYVCVYRCVHAYRHEVSRS